MIVKKEYAIIYSAVFNVLKGNSVIFSCAENAFSWKRRILRFWVLS